MSSAPDPLDASVTVDAAAPDAFAVFTEQLADWWPREFSWSGPDLLEDIRLEPGIDGLLSEIGPHGFRLDWGRILAWDPPRSLSFSWQIGADRVPVPDPSQASTVEVRFEPAGETATKVTVQHAGWERHGEQGHAYRDGFAQAWPHALAAFAEAAGTS